MVPARGGFVSQELKVGSVLDGRFRIISLISNGAFSSVFGAVDDSSGRPVAIKVPFLRYEREPLYLWRFEREERIGVSLDHPLVLRIHPVESKSRPYIVMERLEGAPLSTLLKEGEPMPVSEALGIATQIARALEYLHGRKVVHRDLKPANVIVGRDGSVRLIDLGLAKFEEGPEPGPAVRQSLGTPDYMPPEQVLGGSGDPRSDVYALGAMLYEMVTGQASFRGVDPLTVMYARVVGDPTAPTTLNKAISPSLEEIILRAMDREPGRRYQTALEFRKDLEDPEAVVLTGRVSRLRAPQPWRILWMRSRAFVWALLAIFAFIAVMSTIAWFGRHR